MEMRKKEQAVVDLIKLLKLKKFNFVPKISNFQVYEQIHHIQKLLRLALIVLCSEDFAAETLFRFLCV